MFIILKIIITIVVSLLKVTCTMRISTAGKHIGLIWRINHVLTYSTPWLDTDFKGSVVNRA